MSASKLSAAAINRWRADPVAFIREALIRRRRTGLTNC